MSLNISLIARLKHYTVGFLVQFFKPLSHFVRTVEKRAGTGPQITLLPRGGLDNPELPFPSPTAALLMVMALGLLRER